MADQLLTVEEVATMLRKSPSALRYQIHKGTAPRSARVMGRRMFKLSDVEAFLNAAFAAEEERVVA